MRHALDELTSKDVCPTLSVTRMQNANPVQIGNMPPVASGLPTIIGWKDRKDNELDRLPVG
jgi:hypothetical protein